MTVFAAEEIILQYSALGYSIDAYLPKHKLGREIDEQGHNERSIDYEIESQKAIVKELRCRFIRIDPSKEGFEILNLAEYRITLLNRLKNQLKNL